MSVVVNMIGIISTIFTIGYGILVPNVTKERNYYKSIFEENTIKKTYFNSLNRILNFITHHFGKPFSEQSLSLNTNLAVFYSFAVFFLIYIFTGYGSFGNLEVLNGNIPKSMRFFILLASIVYFIFLYSNYKNIRTNLSVKISVSRKVLLIILSLIPSILISLIISFEWNSIHTVSLNIKTIAILSLAITLSAAILGFSGDGKGSKRGYGALVFNITYLSMVGLSAVFSSFIKIQEYGFRPFVVLSIFIILCGTTYLLWKKKKSIYYYNIFIVALSIFVKNFVPNILGMDIISSSLVYFFVALPFINGLLDYISLSISRLFAAKIMQMGKISTLITHVLVDLLIALVLLCLLILMFMFVTNIFNLVLANNSGFLVSLSDIFKIAIENPLSPNGIWFYSMMFSTLLPTFLHLFIVISSLIFNHPFEAIRQSIIRTINKKNLVTDDKLRLIIYVSIARFGSIAAIVLVLILLVENIGPLFMLWIEELTNLILSI